MKKIFAFLSVLVVLSMVMAGCGTKTPAPTPQATAVPKATEKPAAEPTEEKPTVSGTITLWHGWKEEETAELNKVIAAFQANYPDVKFDVLSVPYDDLRGKYETATGTGGGPSVLIGSADWGPALYDAELVADLSGMASTEFLRTINAAAMGAVKYKGALIGLPQTIKGVVMFRNKSIIAEAPATFDDLVAAAKAATKGDVVGADLEYGFFFSAAHLNGVGGLLMDDKGNPLFSDAKGVAWVNLLKSFKDAGPTEYYTDNDVNLFKAGKAGIIIDGTWNIAGLAEAIGADNLAIDPWPTPLSGYVQTENIYMGANASGDDQKAAWAFMEYFFSAEAQGMLTAAGHIPATVGVEVTDPLMKQAAVAFEKGTAFPVIPEMGAYWEAMDNALKSVFDAGADPQVALQQAFNSVTAKVAETRGQTPPEPETIGTVTLWHGWKEEETEGLNKVIAAFQEKYPDVKFDVLSVPYDDLRGKYETATGTGGGPSVLIGSADWGPALYNAELVADVTELASTPFLASINEAALGAVQYKGALVGLPQTIKGVVMFRNTSIIAEAPATFDDLVAAAKAATQGDVVGADLEYGFFFSAAHLNSVGGALMNDAGDPMFNDAKGVEWVNLLNSFKDAGPAEYYTDNDVNLFKAGKAGIIIDGTWNIAGLSEAIGADNLAIDPWPTPLSGYVQTENIYLNANAQDTDKAVAWMFMEFFLSAQAQAILADVGHIPATVGVEINDPLMQQAAVAFEGGVAFPVIPEMGAYWEAMDNALKSVFDAGADPAEALQAAFDSVTAKVAETRGQ